MPICRVGDCDRQSKSRGWCMMHYKRWHRNGDPTALRCNPKGFPFAEYGRLVSSPSTDCIIWPHAVTGSGYPSVTVDGKSTALHSLSCESRHGVRPEGMVACHDCGIRRCINPQHLRWDTHKGNHADKEKHGTLRRGEEHPAAKLTESQALEIYRAPYGQGSAVGRKYGVTKGAVSAIRSHKSWAWLTRADS